MKGFGDGVPADIDGSLPGTYFLALDVVKLRGHLVVFQVIVRAVDDGDGVGVPIVLDVDDFLGLFGAEIAAGGNEIVVVEMPDERGPRVVEHPLDDAGGDIFVAGVGFEHGALVVVGHGLGFALEVVERAGRAVAAGEGVAEDVNGGEALAAGVKIPVVVNRPEMFFGNEFGEAFFRWNRGTGAGFRVVTPAAASFFIGEPVQGRRVFG